MVTTEHGCIFQLSLFKFVTSRGNCPASKHGSVLQCYLQYTSIRSRKQTRARARLQRLLATRTLPFYRWYRLLNLLRCALNLLTLALQATTAAALQPAGILKADWVIKHRQRKASAAVCLVPRSAVEGDPTAWGAMMAALRLTRSAAAQRSAGIIVAVHQPGPAAELPPDRLVALCHGLDLDAKYDTTSPFVWIGFG